LGGDPPDPGSAHTRKLNTAQILIAYRHAY
jgi:hypothetical protein